jgi:multidrug resistance efflux pump
MMEATMNTLTKKFTLAIIMSLVLVMLLDACSSLQNFGVGVQPEPTPLPTVVESGKVSTEGRLVPVKYSILGFQTGGELDKILVSEGQAVKQGDLLAQLGKREAQEAALAQANMELVSAQQALDKLNENAALARTQSGQALVDARKAKSEAQKALDDLDTEDFRSELDDRILAIQNAKDKLDNAQEDLDKYKDLSEDNATRKKAQTTYDDAKKAYDDAVYERDTLQNQLDAAQAALDAAQARLDDAQKQFDARRDGPDADDLAQAQARLDNTTAQVAAAQRALDNMDLTAPYGATVVDLNDLEQGELVTAGKAVVTLADFANWMVETRDLNELDVVKVEVGQKVSVVPDALPDLGLSGEVESIDRLFTERSGDILYTVRIRLKDSDPRLRWGMTVTVTIEP